MSGAVMPTGRPNVTGSDPDGMARAIKLLQDQVAVLTSHATQVSSAQYLTRQQADALYSPAVMRKELSANGSAPLNVSNLLGVLAEVQP